ncbi:hypothetical protein PGH26_02020 [Sporosarcina jeotgali]|uniref:Uncharacterized protein n=1 Tax=Sporosarcina jeotgali TaxID=3020056 RepID=A0ABZ0KXP0_9BACL|nr:hypothetical protein [Sporosarcina sp. B2O-1]WOV84725.1 hypothetical protein PGH26_02020 [Sporosarcina sp. B2O-1]
MHIREWNTISFIFSEHPKLRKYAYCIDKHAGILNTIELIRVSKSWSTTEKFFLDFVLHLYSANNKIDLTLIDKLDDKNRRLIFRAISYRFNNGIDLDEMGELA